MTARFPSLAPPDTRSWPRTIAIIVIGLAGFALFFRAERTRLDLSFSLFIENSQAAAMQATGRRAPTRSLDVPPVEGSGDNVSFPPLAQMTYEAAMDELRRSGSMMSPTFDGHPASVRSNGLIPGHGLGVHPRFFNCGNSDAAIFQADDDDRIYFLIGTFKVLDYVDGEWRTLGFAENQKYIYNPSSPPE